MSVRGLVLSLVLLGSSLAHAADDLDLKAAIPVLFKVLTYDVNFDARGTGPFVVLVVSDGNQMAARASLVATLRDVSISDVKKRPLKYTPIEFHDETQLQAEIERVKASALLVVPGASPATVKAMWDLAQDNQLYALALEAETVQTAFPLGVTMIGDKPQIVINEKSAKAVGVRFETVVLRMAKVIQ